MLLSIVSGTRIAHRIAPASDDSSRSGAGADAGANQGALALNGRDRLVLSFLARHRIAVTPQVQHLLNSSPRVAQARLQALHDRGYLGSHRIFSYHPASHWITAAGLDAIGSTLPEPNFDLACYQHDIGLGWLWLAARAGKLGRLRELYSERELRSHDGRRDREGPALGVGLGLIGPGGGEQVHHPDLLLVSVTGRRVAVELELTPKGRARLERIMLGYASDARVDAIFYLVPDRRKVASILGAAERAGIGPLVSVALIDGAPEGAPGYRRTLAPGDRVPGQRVPGQRAPGDRAPAQRAPGDRAPAQRAPGDRAPGQRAPGRKAAGHRAPARAAGVERC